jgi:hypothetical protein
MYHPFRDSQKESGQESFSGFWSELLGATKDGLARGIQEHFCRNLFVCLLQLADNQHAMKIVHIEGKEHLESALRKGKGGHCLRSTH